MTVKTIKHPDDLIMDRVYQVSAEGTTRRMTFCGLTLNDRMLCLRLRTVNRKYLIPWKFITNIEECERDD